MYTIYTSRHANKKYFGQDRYSFSYLGVLQRTSLNRSFKHIFQVKVKQHFLHEKGREQTLRRETWSTLLQITLRVFFMSKKHGNHNNKHSKTRSVLFLEKKAPARKLACLIRVCIDQKWPHGPSLPTGTLWIHFPIYFYSCLKEIDKMPKSRYSFLIARFLIAMTRGVRITSIADTDTNTNTSTNNIPIVYQ